MTQVLWIFGKLKKKLYSKTLKPYLHLENGNNVKKLRIERLDGVKNVSEIFSIANVVF